MNKNKENYLLENESFYPKIGGIETSLDEISKILSKKGKKVYILTRNLDGKMKKIEKISKNIIVIRYFCKRNPLNIFISFKQLIITYIIKKKLKERKKIKVVISRNSVLASSSILVGLKTLFIPPGIALNQVKKDKEDSIISDIYYLGRKIKGTINYQFEKFVFKKANKVVVFSKLMKKEVSRLFKIEANLIPPGINNEKYYPIVDRFKYLDKYGLKKDIKYYIFVGRIGAIKNIKLMLEVFKIIADKKTNLLIVGEGAKKDEDYYKKLCSKLEIEDKVIFLGKQNNISELYNLSHFTILLSKSESFGQVITESIACGTPVLGFKQDLENGIKVAFDEIITDKITGFVVQNEAELKKNIILSKEISEKKYLIIRKNCVTHSKKYSWEKFLEKIEELI